MKGIFNKLGDKVTRIGGRVGAKIKKASPELLIVGGVACVIGGTVLACKATKKLDDILEESENTISQINNSRELEDEANDADQLEALIKREVTKEKVMTVGKIIAVYAPAAALITSGVGMIFTSHGIMKQRQATILAAYNAVDAAFRKYRDRVLAEENGKERDFYYMTGKTRKQLEEELNDDSIDSMIDDVNNRAYQMAALDHPLGMYTFIFSRNTSQFWDSHGFSNLTLLRQTEQWATDQIRINGYVFLNDVLRRLGMQEVPHGQLAGWMKGFGDEYVDFGLVDDYRTADMDIDTMKKPIVLEMNCCGSIWEML